MERAEYGKKEWQRVKYHGIAMGGKLYSLRMAKCMTQEELALVLGISPAAISKWERNVSVPNAETLWALADFFDCSIDELVGRTLAQVESLGEYDEEKFRLAVVGEELLKCSELSRAEGLLALEELPGLKDKSRFLAFAVSYILNFFSMQSEQLDLDFIFRMVENYVFTLPESERAEGRMIAEVLRAIVSGRHPKIIQEMIASHIGMDYSERIGTRGKILKVSRQEIFDKCKDKKLYSDKTGLLEEFADIGDFDIQVILRNTDNATLTAALAGASGAVAVRFLSNLSDRMLYFISEDMDTWKGTEEEILDAQRRLLEIGSFCRNESKTPRE